LSLRRILDWHSTLLHNGVHVISQKGVVFDENGIQTTLDLRFLNAKARRREKYRKGPKPFQSEGRVRFMTELTKILSKFAGI